MTRLEQIQNITKDISYKEGWELKLTTRGSNDEVILMYWQFSAPDVKTGVMTMWTSRKYYLSPFKTGSEIVQTAFLAAKVAEEHEILESFQYKGKTLFSPHMNLDHLIQLEIPEDARNHEEQEDHG